MNEDEFWQLAFLASIFAGYNPDWANEVAGKAVKFHREKFEEDDADERD
jgi:hypothetical protein